MLYFSGHNISYVLIILLCSVIFIIFLFFSSKGISDERIIGYSVDVLITPAGKIRHDTVGVIMRKGDSIFIHGTGAYNFFRKDSVQCLRKK